MTELPTGQAASGEGAAGTGGAQRRLPRKPGFMPTAVASVACFLVLFEFLAFQVSSGKDPALGAPRTAAVPRQAAVADRKLIKTSVVHAPAVTSASAPNTGVSTPAVSAAAPSATAVQTTSPVPAPPPTPAPLVTSSS